MKDAAKEDAMGAYPESARTLSERLTWDEAMRVLDNAKAHLQTDTDPKELLSNKVEAEIAMLAFSRLEDKHYTEVAKSVYGRYEIRHVELEAARILKQAMLRVQKLVDNAPRLNNQMPVDSSLQRVVNEMRETVRGLVGEDASK